MLMLALVFSTLSGCVTLGDRKPVATVKFSNGSEIRIRLYYDQAPNTVKNFIYLANSGFYDGTPVHRIVRYFVIQMGKPADDPEKTNAGYYIKGEFPNNGYSKNTMEHVEGTVSMARSVGEPGNEKNYYNSASSQFFIVLSSEPELDGDYAAFGKVMGNDMKKVQQIAKMDVDANEAPRDEIYVESIRVETYGRDYGEPERIYPEEDEE